ncbi:MAG: hypothetical protein HQM01_03220 [Magnetococcales bacterium]|nr:hypothetical protein [Magnetococcales bacterium]
MNQNRPSDPDFRAPFTDNPVIRPLAQPRLSTDPIKAVMPEQIPGCVA